MKILLTNDDGYKAKGIRVLEDVLVSRGHEVWVCAPESQRSGTSHGISVFKTIRVVKYGERHYYCSGFPADCVLFSQKGAFEMGKPDVLISGINMGYNISTDLIYSGTAGAASEGAAQGIKSIAISAEQDDEVDGPFEEAACFLADNLDKLLSVCVPGTFVNINVPRNSNLEWKATGIGHIEYYDNVFRQDGENEFMAYGTAAPDLITGKNEGTDFECVHDKKKIAISVLNFLPSINKEMQEKLKNLTM